MTRYEQKLARIKQGLYTSKDFMIADAKDADMAGGITACGVVRSADGKQQRPQTRAGFLENIQAVVAQDIVDIMLTSASNMELLTQRGVFAHSDIARAIRANDTTDIWGNIRGGVYTAHASRPFRTACLNRANANGQQPDFAADLGLYSITFNNDLDLDMASLNAFSLFRRDAGKAGFKYFLEVFNPNVDCHLSPADMPGFVNDSILRCLAGVVEADRPQFLKVAYNGPAALEELAGYDPGLVVGVLGGSAGTTRDCFELLYQAEKYGARIALFGRKINLAESPLELIRLMRAVTDGAIGPKEAVAAYHGALQQAGICPIRALQDDLKVTSHVLEKAAS